MACNDKKSRSKCPITFALDRLGDKWSLLIVRDLLFREINTYGDFLDNGDGIATNILADRLKCMQEEGIINKSRDPDNGRRVIYSLTAKGLDLAPILFSMMRWSAKYDNKYGVSEEFIQKMEKDAAKVIALQRRSL